jgi:hypothetical protein
MWDRLYENSSATFSRGRQGLSLSDQESCWLRLPLAPPGKSGLPVSQTGLASGLEMHSRREEQRRCEAEQLAQDGCPSSHLTCRCLHSLQPARDFVCLRLRALCTRRSPAMDAGPPARAQPASTRVLESVPTLATPYKGKKSQETRFRVHESRLYVNSCVGQINLGVGCGGTGMLRVLAMLVG